MDLAAVRVFVSDLTPAVTFYERLLGSASAVDPAAGYTVFRGGTVDVVIEVVDQGAPADDLTLVGRFTGLSFRVDDIDAACQKLADGGVAALDPPERQAWGGITATIADPAGNQIQLVQYPN